MTTYCSISCGRCGLELPDQPRPGAAVHRPRPGRAAARHRGQDRRHRAHRLRHRHRSHRGGGGRSAGLSGFRLRAGSSGRAGGGVRACPGHCPPGGDGVAGYRLAVAASHCSHSRRFAAGGRAPRSSCRSPGSGRAGTERAAGRDWKVPPRCAARLPQLDPGMTWMICIWAATARQPPGAANIRRSDARAEAPENYTPRSILVRFMIRIRLAALEREPFGALA